MRRRLRSLLIPSLLVLGTMGVQRLVLAGGEDAQMRSLVPPQAQQSRAQSQAQSESQSQALAAIQQCARANLPQRAFHQPIRLSTITAAGEQRELKGQLVGRPNEAERLDMMFEVRQPPELQGSRYLLLTQARPEAMYVYLPALQRVRQIDGISRGQSLWGSDFSYADMRHLRAALGSDEWEYQGVSQSKRRPLHQLRRRPGGGSQSPYRLIEVDLDAATCLVFALRLYDDAGLVKRMLADPQYYRLEDGRWMIGRAEMRAVREQSYSILELASMDFHTPVSDGQFDPERFHQAN